MHWECQCRCYINLISCKTRMTSHLINLDEQTPVILRWSVNCLPQMSSHLFLAGTFGLAKLAIKLKHINAYTSIFMSITILQNLSHIFSELFFAFGENNCFITRCWSNLWVYKSFWWSKFYSSFWVHLSLWSSSCLIPICHRSFRVYLRLWWSSCLMTSCYSSLCIQRLNISMDLEK